MPVSLKTTLSQELGPNRSQRQLNASAAARSNSPPSRVCYSRRSVISDQMEEFFCAKGSKFGQPAPNRIHLASAA